MIQGCNTIERAGLVAAVEQAADGIVITDIDGRIQYVNPAFSALTGYSSAEAVGGFPRILKSGSHTAAFYAEMWSTIRSGRVWHGEVINRRRDGTLYHEEMQISPVQGANGETVNFIAIKRDVSARRAEADAQSLLAAIVESCEDAVAAYTPGGLILTWNRGAENIFGYSAQEAIGKHVSCLAANPAGMASFTEQVLQNRVVSQHEGLCVRKNGRSFRVSATGSPIRNPAGEVTAISVVLRDVSERQEGERTRALLASIVESSDDAIHGVALDGAIVSWNRGAELLFGYSRVEIVGRPMTLLARPGHSDELLQCLEAIRHGFAISPFETVLQSKDGLPLDVSLSVSPMHDAAGEVTGASGIARDIRQRLSTERKLSESDDRFRAAFAYAPYGMCVSGLDGRFIQVNRALCQMLGYSEQELLGTSWVALTHREDVENCRNWLEELVRGQSKWVGVEKRYQHSTGRLVWTRVRISLVRGSGGDPLYFVAHIEDISEQKRVAGTHNMSKSEA